MIGYRKKVVRKNIENSFPDRTIEELRQIERKFFRHFCDLIVESVKAFTISEKEIQQRVQHHNPDLINTYLGQGKHVTMVGGHYGNWELYAINVAMHIDLQPIALFTPLQNKFMNSKIKNSRSKYGLWMMRYNEIKAVIKKGEIQTAVIFGADQCPKKNQKPHWMQFLNQETGVQFGTEKFARDNNTPVIYGNIYKLKRGYYQVRYQLICEDPTTMEVGMITEAHTKLLEKDIIKEPEYWLWSHKRWKRKRKDFKN